MRRIPLRELAGAFLGPLLQAVGTGSAVLVEPVGRTEPIWGMVSAPARAEKTQGTMLE